MIGAIQGGAIGAMPKPDPAIRARVTFLSVSEATVGQKVEVVVLVPHLTRAEPVARSQGYPAHAWHLYGVVEIPFHVPA